MDNHFDDPTPDDFDDDRPCPQCGNQIRTAGTDLCDSCTMELAHEEHGLTEPPPCTWCDRECVFDHDGAVWLCADPQCPGPAGHLLHSGHLLH